MIPGFSKDSSDLRLSCRSLAPRFPLLLKELRDWALLWWLYILLKGWILTSNHHVLVWRSWVHHRFGVCKYFVGGNNYNNHSGTSRGHFITVIFGRSEQRAAA